MLFGIMLVCCRSMIFSENRCPLFGIMLVLPEHDLFRKPVPIFGIMLVLPEHDLFRKPVPIFGIMLVLPEHDLFRKPVPTFRDHAQLSPSSMAGCSMTSFIAGSSNVR